MMKDIVFLITGKNCQGCKEMKEGLKNEKVKFKEIDRDSEEGKKFVEKFGILSVPTTILDYGGITIIKRAYSKPNVQAISSAYHGITG